VADQKQKDSGEIGEVIDLVKTYVRQETVGPLKNVGRKLGLGVAGSVAVGLGLFFLALGLLRLLQTKVSWLRGDGAFTWAAYAAVIVFCAIVTAIALSRIRKIEKELT
jgi:hypothetical protein